MKSKTILIFITSFVAATAIAAWFAGRDAVSAIVADAGSIISPGQSGEDSGYTLGWGHRTCA
jgi:hypothetical protein